MSRLNDLRPSVEAIFRQRLEEVMATEVVTELGAKKKASKPKLLVLCRPLSASGAGGSTLNVLTPEKDGQLVKIKQAFVVDRLRDVTHDGSFDATFNFGASGMMSVSFESHIQREMFVAAVRRQQDVQQGRVGGGGGGGVGGAGTGSGAGGLGRRAVDDLSGIRGVLSAAVGAEVEADAASRVRKLRQEKRRVFSTEEEQHLLKFMGRSSFDDVRGFQEVLLSRQKEAELSSIDSLVRSAEAWNAARARMLSLVQDAEELENRIEQYSSHLLSKKSVIQEIEHANNTLRQKQENLEGLYVMMAELRDQLSLGAPTFTLLTRLRALPDDGLVPFFSEGRHAAMLSDAMKHMQTVLRNPQLDTDYPIAAVAERKAFFLEQRKMIARRSQSYILSLIQESETSYLADKTRYSHDDHLVWRLHWELSSKLLGIGDIISALPRIDPEGFTSALRKYRTSMQKVYALEVFRFLKNLRKQVKKVSSWRGPFLLGSSETRQEVLAMRVETAQAGETPRMWRGTPSPSPALTPRILHGYDNDDRASLSVSGGCGGGGSSQGGSRMLSIEFPSSSLFNADVKLYAESRTLRRLDARAASGSVVSSIKSLTPSSTSGGGYVRPDLAFAIALESAVLCTLHEEHILRDCFGIGELASETTTAATAATTTAGDGGGPAREPSGGRMASRTGSFIPGAGDTDGGEAASSVDSLQKAAEKKEAATLTLESLLELFGGDRLSTLDGGGGNNHNSNSAGGVHSRTGSRDLGLPPRPPRSQSTVLDTRDFFGIGSRRSSTNNSFSSRGGGGGGGGGRSDGGDGDSGGSGGENSVYLSLSPEDAKRVRQNFLVREMVDLTQYFFDKCDRIYAIPALCMIKAYRHGKKAKPSQSPFCQCMLRELETVVAGAMMRFVAEQTESINRCRKKFLVKSTALLHCFAKMPAFILRMEAVHNALADDVCDRTEYASIASSLVDQSFDALDSVTNVKGASDSGQAPKLKVSELLAKKVHYALEGIAADPSSLKRSLIQQYRHHAFFCAFYSTLPADSYAASLFQDHHDSSRVKRDRYEELYLASVLLVKDFPAFGVFALSVEELSRVYSKEELQHHRTLAPKAVSEVTEKLDKELRSGVRSSAARIKRHFLRDVDPGGNEESFHKTLLQRTWQHFGLLVLQKFDFTVNLLQWSMYQGISLPITRAEVAELLASF